jgi:CheY-like chemotaxis protein
MRVLVVDDSQDGANSLAELIELWGYEARSAYDGPSALRIAREFPANAVLLDIGMPGMSGYDTARALREIAELRGARLVAVTGYGQEEDRTRARDAGFDHHLTKPVDPTELRNLLRSLRNSGASERPEPRHG